MPEDGRRVGHAGIQEEPVHVVASIIVLCNVAAGSEQSVGSGSVRKPQQAISDPVEQAQRPPGCLNVHDVGCQKGQERTQIVHLHATWP